MFREYRLFLVLVLGLLAQSFAQAADPPSVTPGQGTNSATTAAPTNGNAGGTASGSGTVAPSVTIPSSAPAGGVSVTQPPQTADASYYKIAQGVDVTFGWNFTSVIQYPNSLTVQAYCSENGNTYPVGPSTGLPGRATQVVWSPYNYSMSALQNNNLPQLIQAKYRLMIFDERGPNVGASPGLVAPNAQVTFALYNPQAYTPLASGWICGSCNGASSLKAIHPIALGLLASLVVMLASGWGLLARAPVAL
ncbi:hypothetical protein IE53DRAFT_359827 [Violaceomyces palustris]|uniref:Uncharacterized protein n=1 Tax=Violaceomyces palustris TaxID=1673888 RepID=A0ACD0P6C9_9BASI|nr:hypothetical protein IE53DRAFT_359827 [Violaceomyces palustris]